MSDPTIHRDDDHKFMWISHSEADGLFNYYITTSKTGRKHCFIYSDQIIIALPEREENIIQTYSDDNTFFEFCRSEYKAEKLRILRLHQMKHSDSLTVMRLV